MQGRLDDHEEQEREMNTYDRCHHSNRFICICIPTLLVFAPAAQADSLGRLFFTPEQRAQLEYNRTHNAAAEEGNTTSVLMVNGIIQKHGGSRTAWVNGKAQNAGSSDDQHPESLPVSVPGKPQPVKVKVGQKLLLDNPPQPKPVEQKPIQQKPVNTGNEDD